MIAVPIVAALAGAAFGLAFGRSYYGARLRAEMARRTKAETDMATERQLRQASDAMVHTLMNAALAQPATRPGPVHVAATRATVQADPPPPAETVALDAVTPAVLDACEVYAFGNKMQKATNRSYAYTMARQGADEAQILAAIKRGGRREDVA